MAQQAPFDPQGAIVVVTGGASGIGAALCRRFADLGAFKVVVVDLNLDGAREVAAALSSVESGPVGVAMRANCGSEMELRKVIRRTESEVGPIDAFVCNAGIPSYGGPDVPNDEWERIWKVNVMQSVYVARHLFPLWVERGRGSLLITASAAGLVTQVGALPYSVTKHAAVSVAEWLQITYASKGIRVSCLCPQLVNTPMVPPKMGKELGKIVSTDHVAEVAVDAMCSGKFLALPHPEVQKYFRIKAQDYDRWLRGMQKLHAVVGETSLRSPNFGASKL